MLSNQRPDHSGDNEATHARLLHGSLGRARERRGTPTVEPRSASEPASQHRCPGWIKRMQPFSAADRGGKHRHAVFGVTCGKISKGITGTHFAASRKWSVCPGYKFMEQTACDCRPRKLRRLSSYHSSGTNTKGSQKTLHCGASNHEKRKIGGIWGMQDSSQRPVDSLACRARHTVGCVAKFKCGAYSKDISKSKANHHSAIRCGTKVLARTYEKLSIRARAFTAPRTTHNPRCNTIVHMESHNPKQQTSCQRSRCISSSIFHSGTIIDSLSCRCWA
jgi:hypothetical protein